MNTAHDNNKEEDTGRMIAARGRIRVRRAGAAASIVVGLLGLTGVANAYVIQFNDPIAGGSFYKTMTVGQGQYNAAIGRKNLVHVKPPLSELGVKLDLLSKNSSPIVGKSGKVGQLTTCCTQLSAKEGKSSDAVTVGTATHAMNIGGTFRVVPEQGEAAAGFVTLLGKGMIDGAIGVKLLSTVGPPTASFSASIFIEKLGTASASSAANGSQSITLGVSGTLAKEPSVTGSISSSVQSTTTGTGPQNFIMLGKVPVNTNLNWNFIFTLQAKNTTNFLGDYSASWSYLTQQFVNLTPQSSRFVLKKGDPLFSETAFDFQSNPLGGGVLRALHPNRVLEVLAEHPAVQDGGTVGTQPPPTDYSGFLPEVEAVLQEDGNFSTSDRLLNALILWPEMTLISDDGQGRFMFSGGQMRFIDPVTEQLLAEGVLGDLVADANNDLFTGTLQSFSLPGLLPGDSPLADEILASGGANLWLDPGIISETHQFQESASGSPYTVAAAPIPEPGTPALLGVGAWILIGRRCRELEKP
jgi:hypothetical protein